MRYRKRYGIQFDFIIRVGSNQKFQVSFGILNITLPITIIVLIHICLYQSESVLVEKNENSHICIYFDEKCKTKIK